MVGGLIAEDDIDRGGIDLAARLMGKAGRNPLKRSAAKAVVAMARAAADIADALARGPRSEGLGAPVGGVNADGDEQKSLDVIANNRLIAALRNTPTAYYASEEEEAVLTLANNGFLAVAVDPLDGSSNIDCNGPLGTIFSIYPASPEGATASILRPAHEQIAAGYFIYGSHTALVLTMGGALEMYGLDPATGTFTLNCPCVRIPLTTAEFAINTSNLRHWPAPVRAYVEDCLAGTEGPRSMNFNMRWLAAVVGETHRIISRGGIFLYPRDDRRGYGSGRLRHVYEAAPLALLVEAAGGAATDGEDRILDKAAVSLHERTPLVLGSREEVDVVKQYHRTANMSRSPLFSSRGLFRN